MEKIPTIFIRDWNGNPQYVTTEQNPDAQWVFDGEGIATQKVDGTCCLVREGELFKRREVKPDRPIPENFNLIDTDKETGKIIGWVPVNSAPEDRYHREAFENAQLTDGTYELVGPKIQGNPEHYSRHWLLCHADLPQIAAPRSFPGLREWFQGKDIEGIVWHHPDGRMAKIKQRDFGLRRVI